MAEFTDRQGRTIEVPDEEVQQGKRVHLVDPRSGSLANVEAHELGQALQQGFELADPETVERAQVSERTSAFEAFVQGGGEQARPLTSFIPGKTGLTVQQEVDQRFAERRLDQLQFMHGEDEGRRLFEQEQAEEQRQSQLRQEVIEEEHGFAKGLGAVTATGLSGIAGGPGGAGRLASRALAREGIEAGARGIGRRVVREGAEEAVEGAVFEAKRALSETDLGPTELTGERLAASIGIGSLVGFGGGALLAGTSTLLGAGARATKRGVAGAFKRTKSGLKQVWGESRGATLTDQAADTYARFLDRTRGEGSGEIVRRALADTPEGAEVRRLIREGDSVLEDAVPSIRQQIDELDQATMQTQQFAKGSLKRGNIMRGIKELDDRAAGESRVLVDELRTLADEIDASPAAFEGATFARKRLRNLADEAEDAVTRGTQRGGAEGAADAFMALDSTKRAVGQMRVKATRSGFVKDRFEQLYERYRKSLEDADLWGNAPARAQQEINSVWAPMIANSGEFSKRFMARSGRKQGFDTAFTADPSKLETHLKNIGTGKNQLADEVFERQLQLQQRFQDVVETHYDMPSDASALLGKSRQSAQQLSSKLDEIRRAVETRNQLDDLSSGIDLTGLGSAVGATVGGTALGGLGAGVGATVGGGLAKGLTSPRGAVQTLAVMKDLTAKMRRKTDDGAKAWVERATKPKPKLRAPDKPKGRDNLIPPVVTPATLEAFEDRIDKILDATASPETTVEQTQKRLADVSQAAPDSATHAARTAQRGLEFLSTKVPPSAQRRRSTITPHLKSKMRVPDLEVSKFLRYLRAVEDPSTVVDDLAEGRLTLEAVEAMREVYPRMYESVVASVHEQLADADHPPPYEDRLRLGILLGTTTDPSLEPSFIARMQEQLQRPPQDEQAPPRSGPDLGGRMLSGMQGLQQREPA